MAGPLPTTDLNYNQILSVLDNMGQVLGMAGKMKSDATRPKIGMTTTTDENGTTHDISIPDEEMRKISQVIGNYSQVVEAYQSELSKIEARQKSMNPIVNALATVAGNLATNDPRLPPVVRALGQSNRQLNPTSTELSERRLAVASGLGKAENEQVGAISELRRAQDSQIELERGGEYLKLAQEKEAREKEAGVQKETDARTKNVLLRAHNAAKGGEPMNEAGFRALARVGLTADDIKKNPRIVDDLYQEHVADAAAIKAGLNATTDRQKELIEERGKVARENAMKAFELKKDMFSMRKDWEKEFAKYRAEMKQDEGMKLVNPKNLDRLGGLESTEKFLDRVEDILSKPEYQSMPGFKSALLDKVPNYLKPADRIEFENLLAHETPRILDLVLRSGTGGASILRTEQGRQLIAALGISKTNTPDQALKIIKNIRGTVHDQRLSIATESPEADWDRRRLVLGRDADDIISYVSTGKSDPGGLFSGR
jgi:glutaredoxin 2